MLYVVLVYSSKLTAGIRYIGLVDLCLVGRQHHSHAGSPTMRSLGTRLEVHMFILFYISIKHSPTSMHSLIA